MYISSYLVVCLVLCSVCGFNGFQTVHKFHFTRSVGLRSSRIAAFSGKKFIPHVSTFFFNGKSGTQSDKFMNDAMKLNGSAVCDLVVEKPKNKIKALLSSIPSAAKKAVEKLRGIRKTSGRPSVVVNGTASPYAIALCVGGDGTINWIMDEASSQAMNASSAAATPDVRFALIPSGTGNDLYRHMMLLLQQYNSPSDMKTLRNKIAALSRGDSGSAQEALDLFTSNNTVCVPFDRWSLTIDPLNTREVMHYRRLLKAHGPLGAEKARREYELWFRDTHPHTPYKGVPTIEPVVKTFNNYFGMGVDAAVTLRYQRWRQQWPRWLFNTHPYLSRFFYGLAWVWLSLWAFFPRPLVSLEGNTDVSLLPPTNGGSSSGSRRSKKEINIFEASKYVPVSVNATAGSSAVSLLLRPFKRVWSTIRELLKWPQSRQYAGLVVSNINSFAGGGRLWPPLISRDGIKREESRSDDGKLELNGLTNWAHLMLVTFKLDNAYPLCQEKSLTLVSNSCSLPMQVDGEAWMQEQPCKISIKHLNSVKLLLPHLPSIAKKKTSENEI